MLKFITVIVICYFGKLENNKSSIFGPATIFWTRDNLSATRGNLPATRDTRHAPIRLSPQKLAKYKWCYVCSYK